MIAHTNKHTHSKCECKGSDESENHNNNFCSFSLFSFTFLLHSSHNDFVIFFYTSLTFFPIVLLNFNKFLVGLTPFIWYLLVSFLCVFMCCVAFQRFDSCIMREEKINAISLNPRGFASFAIWFVTFIIRKWKYFEWRICQMFVCMTRAGSGFIFSMNALM